MSTKVFGMSSCSSNVDSTAVSIQHADVSALSNGIRLLLCGFTAITLMPASKHQQSTANSAGIDAKEEE
jgi:hypothetical protein